MWFSWVICFPKLPDAAAYKNVRLHHSLVDGIQFLT